MAKRVIVIDDEKPIRDSFTLALEDTEFIVDTASSGMEGLDKIDKEKYDLVYLDLKMPGMNGIETLRKIREKDKNVLIYIVTAFSREFFVELEKLQEEELAFEILHKPIDMKYIIEITTILLTDTD